VAFNDRCIVVPDEPRAGLSAALAHGAQIATERWPSDGVVAVAADIPTLTPSALDALFDALAAIPTADRPADRFVVADAAGVGTALLAAQPQVSLTPAYEGGSLAAHLAGGAYDATPFAAATLRCDVDTADDLRAALALGAGEATLRTLAAHGLDPGDLPGGRTAR
jgi:2-phospho-L-lactate guanylyltransferase